MLREIARFPLEKKSKPTVNKLEDNVYFKNAFKISEKGKRKTSMCVWVRKKKRIGNIPKEMSERL